MENGTIFESFTIKDVTFKNRILRSSIGGRTAYYDGTVTSAWKNFERRFAENDVAGIISATLTVDERRWSPLEYPKISNDKFIKPLREGSQEIKTRVQILHPDRRRRLSNPNKLIFSRSGCKIGFFGF